MSVTQTKKGFMQDAEKVITRSFTRFFQGTLLSRFSGLARDMCLAFFFGTTPLIAAFMVSFRFANLFRRLFGESLIGNTFIPFYEEIHKRDPIKASLFYRDLFFSLGISVIGLVVILTGILYPFWGEKISLYTNIMLFGLIFVTLYALNLAFLQYHKRFFLPAMSPALFNIVFVVGIALARGDVGLSLSFCVVVAFLGMWLPTQVSSFRYLVLPRSFWYKPRLFSKEVRKLFKPISYGILAVGAVQVNSALDALFARFADLSGPSYLWFAIRLQQLPIALFGVGIASSVFPPLVKSVAVKEKFQFLLQTAIKRGMILMMFSTFGIFALGKSSINLLFGRGDFTAISVEMTSRCLSAYAGALVPTILVFVFTSALQAQKQFRIPAITALISVVVNILLNGWFVFGLDLGAISVALSTSFAAGFQAVFLALFFKEKFFVWKDFAKIFCVGLAAYLWTSLFQEEVLPREFFQQCKSFILLALHYTGVFLVGAKILRVQGINELLKKPM